MSTDLYDDKALSRPPQPGELLPPVRRVSVQRIRRAAHKSSVPAWLRVQGFNKPAAVDSASIPGLNFTIIHEVGLQMMALLGEIFLHGKDSHDFYQLTGAQKKILLFLAMNGKQRMGDVAHMISSSMPAASAVVDRLEQLGLVERKRDGLDRRVVMVELTERGGRVHMEMVRVRESRMAYLLNSLPEESRSQYINCLIQMNSLFKEAAVKAEEKSTPKAPPVAASSDL